MPRAYKGKFHASRTPSASITTQIRCHRLALLGSTAVILAGAFFAHPVQANDECGFAPSVVCDAGDNAYPFANGITYDPVDDLTLIVASGAAVAGTNGIFVNGGDVIDLTVQSGASIVTTGSIGMGIVVTDSGGSATIRLLEGAASQLTAPTRTAYSLLSTMAIGSLWRAGAR